MRPTLLVVRSGARLVMKAVYHWGWVYTLREQTRNECM